MKKGFTLIELLVTITIIAILAAIGLVTYSMALKQGRDSKRQSDLRAIQSALEQYYNDQFYYPSNVDRSMNDRLLTGGWFNSNIGNPSPPVPSPKSYMNSLPQDPIKSSSQFYAYLPLPYSPACDNRTVTSRCTSYCLYAKLENPPSPIPPLPAGCISYTGFTLILTPP